MAEVSKSTRGFVEALLVVSFLAALCTVPALALEPGPVPTPAMPSPDLLRGIAGLGGALFLAYVVQAAWMVRESPAGDDREHWVGFITGTGAAGLVGVVLTLLLAEHRAAGHENAIGVIGCAWALIALILLGSVVVLQPLLAYRVATRLEADGEKST